MAASAPSLFAADSAALREARGRQIYHTGTSPAGRPITAYFGKELLEVPGESATCASCHGHDGLGRSESGVQPSDITWRHLMKSYGHLHPGGRRHPAFSEQSLMSYLQDGVFPGGVAGDPAMPVYDMDDGDLQDLLAYCRTIGIRRDPGITGSSIRIGVITAETGAADFPAMVRAVVTDINAMGGIFGRSLELVPFPAGNPEPELRRAVEEAGVFALICGYGSGGERCAAVAESIQIPCIGTFAPVLPPDGAVGRYGFFLHAGRQLTRLPSSGLPGEVTGWGAAELQALADRYGMTADLSPARVYAYAVAKILVEGLRRSGKEVSRERLVDILEGMFEFETGVTRRVTFGKNRRIGIAGSRDGGTGPP